MNVLIFGATSGIGRKLAELYAKEGNKVAITGRREEKLKEIQSSYPQLIFPYKHDIREVEKTPFLIDELSRKIGGLDLIIVNAGIGKFNTELDWKICESVLKTNILGVTSALTSAYNYFKKQGKGHVVNVSSVASLLGNPLNPSYNASKAYQANFMESLWMKAQKTKKAKIFVTDIRPGYVDTKLAEGQKFMKAGVTKAAIQIKQAIHKKKRIAYITHSWGIIAWFLKRMPRKLLIKIF